METYKVYLKGGSIGEANHSGENHYKYGKFIKEYNTREEAKEHCKDSNSRLSKGEKSYYGLKYTFRKTITK